MNLSKPTIALIVFIFIAVGAWAVTTITDTGIESGGDITLPENSVIKLYNSETSGHTTSMEFYQQNGEAKPYLAWYDNYNYADPVMTGWFGCHYNNTAGDIHRHCSFETNDSDVGYAETKLEMSYGTWRNQSYITATNIEWFRLGAGVDFRISSGDIINQDKFINVYTNNQTTEGMRWQNYSDAFVISAIGLEYIEIPNKLRVGGSAGNGEVIIAENSSTRSCSASKAGSIMFDGTKHYGCDGSGWNALY